MMSNGCGSRLPSPGCGTWLKILDESQHGQENTVIGGAAKLPHRRVQEEVYQSKTSGTVRE